MSFGLKKYIQRLRRKLGDDARNPIWIKTIHGIGYRFGASASRSGARPETALVWPWTDLFPKVSGNLDYLPTLTYPRLIFALWETAVPTFVHSKGLVLISKLPSALSTLQ